MSKRTLATAYAVLCTLLLVGGAVTCFVTAFLVGIDAMAKCVVGMAIGIFLAPVLHETGHIAFAKGAGMEIVYVKALCFALEKRSGKWKFRFASPFAPDETQVVPKSGENMQNRALRYTAGGLVFSGVLFILLLIFAVLLSVLVKTPFKLWGMCIYTGYLFLLNVAPFEYASGKTDSLVYRGIKKGYDSERVMLSAMTVHGEAYAGKRYGEIEEKYYFDLPVLAEDERLFTLITELRYRYFVDREDFKNGAKQLNRLASLQAYMTDVERERVCAELVFLHALNGDMESAEACGKLCRAFLQGETATAKRVMATFINAFGDKAQALALREDGERLLPKEWLTGERLWEEKLLARIQG